MGLRKHVLPRFCEIHALLRANEQIASQRELQFLDATRKCRPAQLNLCRSFAEVAALRRGDQRLDLSGTEMMAGPDTGDVGGLGRFGIGSPSPPSVDQKMWLLICDKHGRCCPKKSSA